ncbi:MAG: 2-C-methyl-D-erythritol 4-phosphate cytidylyltransferase [Bacteroidales bacterium 45-6]|nr:MAG: 2-C-methyl-D-erythritol 4-phosphate cytidylyltransferase [Bacteroidales bacterium 45-6]
MSDKHVIIVAGGKGLRMGTDIPKQFLPIGGKPVLMWTLEAFAKYRRDIHIVLVLPESFLDYWSGLCSHYHFAVAHEIAFGGETRFHSVKNGLEKIHSGYVAVHDGARPFASEKLIASCFGDAEKKQATIPVVPMTDSCRILEPDGGSRILNRSCLRLVQTPQVFSVDLLKKAYDVPFQQIFTDDASVVEYWGHRISLVEGETNNIKITNPIDLKMGEWILGE